MKNEDDSIWDGDDDKTDDDETKKTVDDESSSNLFNKAVINKIVPLTSPENEDQDEEAEIEKELKPKHKHHHHHLTTHYNIQKTLQSVSQSVVKVPKVYNHRIHKIKKDLYAKQEIQQKEVKHALDEILEDFKDFSA